MRATLVALDGRTRVRFLAPVKDVRDRVDWTRFLFPVAGMGLLMAGVGSGSRVGDGCFGLGGVDDTERVVEVSGEEDVIGSDGGGFSRLVVAPGGIALEEGRSSWWGKWDRLHVNFLKGGYLIWIGWTWM